MQQQHGIILYNHSHDDAKNKVKTKNALPNGAVVDLVFQIVSAFLPRTTDVEFRRTDKRTFFAPVALDNCE